MRTQISEDLISKSIKAIIDSGIAAEDKMTVPKEFKGYISSFGASVIQSGILPALIFFEDKGGAQKDRPKLLKAIMLIQGWTNRNSSLVEHYKTLGTTEKKSQTEKLILDSAIALKLALRTFKFA